MKKIYMSAFFLCTTAVLYSQNVLWQKDIKSTTQDFLSQVTTTIDGQYLISGSSIQSSKLQAEGGKQNNGYDFHLVKLNQQGEEVWEKYFSSQNHDFLSAAVNTQEGGFLLAGTSYSGKGMDKKDARLLKLAKETFKGNDLLRKESNGLIEQLIRGDMSPGIGTKNIGKIYLKLDQKVEREYILEMVIMV